MTSLPCNRTNDALVGSTRICIMPEMRIQNRNYSTYPTMPKPCSTIGSRLKHPRVTWLLKDLDMDLNTMEDLSEGFHMWSSNQLPLQMLTDTSHLQSFILWDNFSHGFLAVNWQTQQQNYYKNKQLCHSGVKWATVSSNGYWRAWGSNGTIAMTNYTENSQTKSKI